MSNRLSRKAAPLVVLSAVLGLLSACTKPLPEITVYGNGKSIIVPAASYKFPGGPLHTKIDDFGKAPTLKIEQGSQLLVDVPHTIATHAWVVAAFTLDAQSKSTQIPGAGSVVVRDQHTTRLAAAPAGIDDYYLQVAELRGTVQTGGWVLHITTAG